MSINIFTRFTQTEPITKGWSQDKKYRVTDADGTKYLLRVSPMERYENRKALFGMLQKLSALKIPMCQPVEFGVCEEGAYMLQSWIDGEDLEALLPALTETEQYALGFRSGEILRKMHVLPAPPTQEDWAARFNRKIDWKIQKHFECGIHFEGEEHALDFIAKNRCLLENRPQCFQHGDYHAGNMMLENGEIKIIDFDRNDFGDPWEEFNRITWSAAASPHFATGQLRGYFDGEPPPEFFKLLAFYIACNTMASFAWAVPYGEKEVATMMKQAQDVLAWFGNMKNPVPTWYLQNFYVQWVDEMPVKLKAPFDLSFLKKHGRVFKVFDEQDSGNLCFGTEKDGKRFFVKFAGAPTVLSHCKPEDAIARLKDAAPVYKNLAHPNLIRLVAEEETCHGYVLIFDWVDAECMGKQYPQSRQKFMAMPMETKLRVFEEIMEFHAHVAAQGYVAIDFYDGGILYDFANAKTILCDVDSYAKAPYTNTMGRMYGSSRFMSPEEFTLGATIDETTNVYTMGATAFVLFSENDRSQEAWPLNAASFAVVKQAVSDDRSLRQKTIRQLMKEWKEALRAND